MTSSAPRPPRYQSPALATLHPVPFSSFKFQASRFALTLPLASPLVTPPSTPGSRRATLARVNVTVRGRTRHFRTVAFDPDRNAVLLIEQRLLPHEFRIVRTLGFRQTARAITDMVVRGAGAIGATAAYGLAQGARAFRGRGRAAFRRHLETVSHTLKAARPTAVDPVNAINQVRAAMRAGQTVEEQQALALAAAEEFANEDVCHCQDIGRHGARLIRNGMNVLTHCNAGWLAFVDVGSATAPMYAAQAQGKRFHVFCDETRPRAQGATLTAWELAQQKISHQIIAGGVSIRLANPTSGAVNPGLDVAPAELTTGITPPAGIFKPRELWAHRHEL